ncbi:hypothetical protein CF168_17255 [Shewanella bicestrii]|uniref:Uncharacterized protein n=1 Tax=Shewanella bicestrii TaxID=2018305 RepID=A0A220UQG0_9GAMM|nr:hypothetical protein [Shewanella bicestrii]ASK70464.1 hypothetical protein CF168_17255 [Shewanella bicestrii]
MTHSLLSKPGVKLHFGLNTHALLEAIAQANDIVLHAAIYSNFADNAVGQLLLQRLQSASFKQLTLIKLEPTGSWRDEFATILRPEMPLWEVERLYENSRHWCAELKRQFPETVNLVSTQALPLQPILLIGDRLFVGHYAHSHTTSAQGLWIGFDVIALGLTPNSLIDWFYSGVTTEQDSPVAITLGRYVEECRRAVGDLWYQSVIALDKERH